MYSPKRNVTLMPAVALATLSALIAIPALSQSRLYAAAPVKVAVVTVQSGDNLWSIAERFTAAGGDVQETIDQIKEANHLADATVIPGQRLQVLR